MGQAHLHRDRQIDDNIIAFAGLQHIQDSIADLQGVFRLRAREALGRILEAEVALVLGGQLLDQLGPVHGDLLDLLLRLLEHLLPLGNGGGIVEGHL